MIETQTEYANAPMFIRQFSGLTEVLTDFGKLDSSSGTAKFYALRSAEYADRTWLGVDGGVSEVESLVRKGWSAGVKMIDESIMKELPAPVSLRRVRHWGDRGDEYDIHRSLRGQHDRAWLSRKREARNAPRRITIVCDIACSANEDAQKLVWKGVAALKLSDALEESGYQVRIVGINANLKVNSDGHGMVTEVACKGYDAPLDKSSLASLLMLTGFKRYYLHAFHYGGGSQQARSELGYPRAEVGLWYANRVTEESDSPTLYVGRGVTSKDACIKCLDEAAAKIEALTC